MTFSLGKHGTYGTHKHTHSRTPTSQKMQSTLRAFRGSLIFCSVHLLVPFGDLFCVSLPALIPCHVKAAKSTLLDAVEDPSGTFPSFHSSDDHHFLTWLWVSKQSAKAVLAPSCTQILTQGEADKDDAKAQRLAALGRPSLPSFKARLF